MSKDIYYRKVIFAGPLPANINDAIAKLTSIRDNGGSDVFDMKVSGTIDVRIERPMTEDEIADRETRRAQYLALREEFEDGPRELPSAPPAPREEGGGFQPPAPLVRVPAGRGPHPGVTIVTQDIG